MNNYRRYRFSVIFMVFCFFLFLITIAFISINNAYAENYRADHIIKSTNEQPIIVIGFNDNLKKVLEKSTAKLDVTNHLKYIDAFQYQNQKKAAVFVLDDSSFGFTMKHVCFFTATITRPIHEGDPEGPIIGLYPYCKWLTQKDAISAVQRLVKIYKKAGWRLDTKVHLSSFTATALKQHFDNSIQSEQHQFPSLHTFGNYGSGVGKWYADGYQLDMWLDIISTHKDGVEVFKPTKYYRYFIKVEIGKARE